VAVAAAVALGGVFAAFAAGSTHTHARKTAVRPTGRASAPPAAVTTAPAPPLVSVEGGASAPAQSSQSPQPVTPAPAPAYTPPVVVSGGS
jgi:hypothetical protein